MCERPPIRSPMGAAMRTAETEWFSYKIEAKGGSRAFFEMEDLKADLELCEDGSVYDVTDIFTETRDHKRNISERNYLSDKHPLYTLIRDYVWENIAEIGIAGDDGYRSSDPNDEHRLSASQLGLRAA